MHDKTNVTLVNTHPKRDRRYDDLDTVGNKITIDFVFLSCRHSGVIGFSIDPFGLKKMCDVLRGFP